MAEQLNDNIHTALGGAGNNKHINDLLMPWMASEGLTYQTLPAFLYAAGHTQADINDQLMSYFAGGTINHLKALVAGADNLLASTDVLASGV